MDCTLAPAPPEERRQYARVTSGFAGVRARLLPGLELDLIDLSRSGACVGSRLRLLPGTRVLVQFAGPAGALMVRSRVTRCTVSALGRGQDIRYRGAVQFDEPIENFVNALPTTGSHFPSLPESGGTRHGNSLPAAPSLVRNLHE